MNRHSNLFKDRREAGESLAGELASYAGAKTLVLGLPRGGVPVAAAVARALSAPLDTLVVRKIGRPSDPEYGLGAIAPEGVVYLDESTPALEVSEKDIDRVIAREQKELERRAARYRSGFYSEGFAPERVVIVDDGIATGGTAMAAIRYARKRWPRARVILAAPVCAADTAARVRRECEVVCIRELPDLVAIGIWYEKFPQLSDDEVVGYLAERKRARVGAPS